ncbi:hypothetical protein N2152v2_007136 [Parachlorella kessleri]
MVIAGPRQLVSSVGPWRKVPSSPFPLDLIFPSPSPPRQPSVPARPQLSPSSTPQPASLPISGPPILPPVPSPQAATEAAAAPPSPSIPAASTSPIPAPSPAACKTVLDAVLDNPSLDILAQLLKLLKTHVVPGLAVRSRDLSDGQVLPTLNAGETLTVDRSSSADSVKVKPSLGQAATVVSADVEACKSILHIIDKVLLPSNALPGSKAP